MKPGDIISVRVGKHPKRVKLLAIVNSGRTLRVANIDAQGEAHGSFCVRTERLVKCANPAR